MARESDQERLSGAQLRAARALLGLSSETLAEESRVSLRTIRRAEKEHGTVVMTEANEAALIAALQKRGVMFALDGSDGVSLKKRAKFAD